MNEISIAIIVPEMLPVPAVHGGAVEHWVEEVSKRMVSFQHRITVVSRPSGIEGHTGVQHIDIPWTRTEKFFQSIKRLIGAKRSCHYLAKIQNVYSYGRRAMEAVDSFDVIYIHNEPNLLFFLKPRPSQKIVLHMHNDHLSIKMLRPFYRRMLEKTDSVIFVSDYIKSRAVSLYPEYASRFKVVLNSTDPETFKPYGETAWKELEDIIKIQPYKQYLLYVGRLVPEKGIHVLIKAFQIIHQHAPELCLVITGSSFFANAAKTKYEQELIALAEPLRHAILFTGYLPHAKLKYLYSAATIVVVPSIWQEPSGLVVLEAMASGTCLISSAVGGIPEVIEDGGNGWLVLPSDPTALAERVITVLKNPGKKLQIESEARRTIVKNHTWERLQLEIKNVIGEDEKI